MCSSMMGVTTFTRLILSIWKKSKSHCTCAGKWWHEWTHARTCVARTMIRRVERKKVFFFFLSFCTLELQGILESFGEQPETRPRLYRSCYSEFTWDMTPCFRRSGQKRKETWQKNNKKRTNTHHTHLYTLYQFIMYLRRTSSHLYTCTNMPNEIRHCQNHIISWN